MISFNTILWPPQAPAAKVEPRTKATLLPGDGVGPELCHVVMDVFKAAGKQALLHCSSRLLNSGVAALWLQCQCCDSCSVDTSPRDWDTRRSCRCPCWLRAAPHQWAGPWPLREPRDCCREHQEELHLPEGYPCLTWVQRWRRSQDPQHEAQVSLSMNLISNTQLQLRCRGLFISTCL